FLKGVYTLRFPPFNPYFAIVIGVIAVSASAILVKLAAPAPAGIIAFYRMFLAVIMMVPTIYLKYRDEIKTISKKNWVLAAISGLLLALHFILWLEPLTLTSVASSVVLVALRPICAFLGTYFFVVAGASVVATLGLFITLSGSVIIGCG